MAEKEVLLTQNGLSKLEKELEHLKTVKRREVAARIKHALEFGDISENSEYDDAKNEQAFIEGRIANLERLLRNARLIDAEETDENVVTVGSKVKLKDLEFGDEYEYILVGSAEADPSHNKISNESPVGQAVIGKQVGAIVEVNAPAGLLKFQITSVTR
ncbi:MAG TPA: transcription elongation factor GreA [Firmicutes bacterium]|nr:transcription elongation factor GreA [Bacillota bacterium]